jgi:soluble lytic murein transglycosylase
VSRRRSRVRRDGLPAMLLFVAVPFAAIALGMGLHPAGILDSEEEIRARTEAWRPLAKTAAAEAGVPLDLLLALVATESSGRQRATSGSGAMGLTQLMPGTALGKAAELGVEDPEGLDMYDPAVNLRLGSHYLAEQLRDFAGDPALALAAYHRGPGGPREWRRGAAPGRAGIDLVRDKAPSVTRAYVERALSRRRWFEERPAPSPPPPVEPALPR